MANEQKLLTILVPTRNRPNDVRQLVRILNSLFRNSTEVEIMISDNSDTQMETIESELELTVIRSPTRFKTAEEHLFYGFQFVQGEYVWPLGDDDIPTVEGVEALMDVVRAGIWDACAWNARNLGDHGLPVNWSRVDCQSTELELSYVDFLSRMGFWSIPAGISLTVFKRKLIDHSLIELVDSLESPIYSHVVLYTLLFDRARFAFINRDLVLYRTNRHDIEVKTEVHWKNYSVATNHFFRFPWTLGLIRQLKFLNERGILPRKYLASALDISHFGPRFLLLENITDMFLEQLEFDLTGESTSQMTDDEVLEFVSYMEDVAPDLSVIWTLARSVTEADRSSRKYRINLARQIRLQRRSLSISGGTSPFNRYYRGLSYQHILFETPLGWIAFPQNVGKMNLHDALLGIEFPRYYEKTASSRVELEMKLKKLEEWEGDDFDRIGFFLSGQDYQIYRRPELTRVENLWFSLPLGVKRIYQAFPVGIKRRVRKILFK